MVTAIATPKKRGRPAKAKEPAEVTPKAKGGRPKRQEKAIPEKEDELPLVPEEKPVADAPKQIEANKKKPVSKATSKVKQSLEAEIVNPASKQPSEDSRSSSNEGDQVPASSQPVPKKLKSGKQEEASPSKGKTPTKPKKPIRSEAESKPELNENGSTQTPSSTSGTTSKIAKTLNKGAPIEFKPHPLPNFKDVTSWASKYKEGLLITEGKFLTKQLDLSKKVHKVLTDQNILVPYKKILVSLDDYLFGNKSRLSVETGLDVSTLWLLVAWRYLRGTFKPSVLQLVKQNEDVVVQKATVEVYHSVKKALEVFKITKKPDDVFCIKHQEAIIIWVSLLSKLSGISAVSATAVLSMITEEIPYMSEEGLEASLGTPNGSHKDSTLKAYLDHVGSIVQKLGGKVTPREIEAGWYYHSC